MSRTNSSAHTELFSIDMLRQSALGSGMVAAANLVEVAALVGDTARATMLNALMGGQSLTAKVEQAGDIQHGAKQEGLDQQRCGGSQESGKQGQRPDCAFVAHQFEQGT